jgi:hypothetical protein
VTPDATYALARQYAELAGDKVLAARRFVEAKRAGDGFAVVAAEEALTELRRRLDAVHRQVRA